MKEMESLYLRHFKVGTVLLLSISLACCAYTDRYREKLIPVAHNTECASFI